MECLFKDGGGDMQSISLVSELEKKKKIIPQMWLTFEFYPENHSS